VLILTAQAAPGSAFSGWSGIVGCSTGPCPFTVTSSAQATATFVLLGLDAGSVDAAAPDASTPDAATTDAAGNPATPDAGAPPGDEVGTASCGCHATTSAFPWTGLAVLFAFRSRRKTQLSGAPHTNHSRSA
jgi:hypothetical protein